MVDFDMLSFDEFSVQVFDGLIGLRIAGHFDKAESFRYAGSAVADDFAAIDVAKRDKQALQSVHGNAGGEITDVNVHGRIHDRFRAIGLMDIRSQSIAEKPRTDGWRLCHVSRAGRGA